MEGGGEGEVKTLRPGSSSGTNGPSDPEHVPFPLWASVSTRLSVKRRGSWRSQWNDAERTWPSVDTRKNLNSVCDSLTLYLSGLSGGSVRKHTQSTLLQAQH